MGAWVCSVSGVAGCGTGAPSNLTLSCHVLALTRADTGSYLLSIRQERIKGSTVKVKDDKIEERLLKTNRYKNKIVDLVISTIKCTDIGIWFSNL